MFGPKLKFDLYFSDILKFLEPLVARIGSSLLGLRKFSNL